MVRIPRQCPSPVFDNLVRCDTCVNTTVSGVRSYACNCSGTSNIDNRTAVTFRALPVNTSNCGCVNFGNRSTCDCCVTDPIWSAARPVCGSASTSEACQCQNITTTTRFNTSTTSLVNRTTTFTCRPTGCSGEICGNVARGNLSSTCRWNNTFACFSNAVCEYQNSTGDCGWTVNSALTQCIARNASADPRLFQNLTTSRNVTVRNITARVNNTIITTFNVTNSTWACNCSNSRYPRNPLVNAPVTFNACGCNNNSVANRICDCCVDRNTVDNLFLAAHQCRTLNTTVSNCVCNDNFTCNCAAPNAVNLTYIAIPLNANNCSCVKRANSSLNECRCCIPTIQQRLIPAAPVCGFNSDPLGCTCDIFGGNLRCNCNNGTTSRVVSSNQTVVTPVFNATTNRTVNVTSTRVVNSTIVEQNVVRQVLPQSQCGCLTTINGNVTSRQCNCCV